MSGGWCCVGSRGSWRGDAALPRCSQPSCDSWNVETADTRSDANAVCAGEGPLKRNKSSDKRPGRSDPAAGRARDVGWARVFSNRDAKRIVVV